VRASQDLQRARRVTAWPCLASPRLALLRGRRRKQRIAARTGLFSSVLCATACCAACAVSGGDARRASGLLALSCAQARILCRHATAHFSHSGPRRVPYDSCGDGGAKEL
jgi:hypothetical protein